jgi:hypothetical protein
MRKSKPKLGSHAKTDPNRLTADARRLRTYGPLPPAHPFYEIVDRVSSEWAHLEHALDMIIWELAGIDQKLGSCVTGQLGGHWPRINAITALASAKGVHRTLIRELELFGNGMSELAKKRNRFVQAAWYSDGVGKAGRIAGFPAREKQFGPKDFGEADARDLISRIDAQIIELWQVHSRLRSGLT